jgi:putative Holliday junction resolvase
MSSSPAGEAALVSSVFLAFDFGLVRIGVAVGNGFLKTAQPLEVISANDNQTRFARIEALIAQWKPDTLVVGIPRHPDGVAHEMTQRCQKFSRQLEGRFNLPVRCVDERYSSVEATARMQPKRGQAIDAMAACIILEQYFLECSA